MIPVAENLFQPMLAFDGGGVGVIVFIVISFISWIMNTIQASKQKQEARERQERRRQRQQAAQQGGGAARGEAVRGEAGGKPAAMSEIEAFLEEVTGQKKPQPPPQRQQPPPRPSKPRPRPQRAQKPPRPPRPPQPKTPPKPAELGGGVSQHVSTYMSDRIGEHVEQDIAGSVDSHIIQHVSEHIGVETATDDHLAKRKTNRAAAQIRDMLSDGDGVRRAILVNEILKRRTFDR